MKEKNIESTTVQDTTKAERFVNDTVWERVYEEAGLKNRFSKINS